MTGILKLFCYTQCGNTYVNSSDFFFFLARSFMLKFCPCSDVTAPSDFEAAFGAAVFAVAKKLILGQGETCLGVVK